MNQTMETHDVAQSYATTLRLLRQHLDHVDNCQAGLSCAVMEHGAVVTAPLDQGRDLAMATMSVSEDTWCTWMQKSQWDDMHKRNHRLEEILNGTDIQPSPTEDAVAVKVTRHEQDQDLSFLFECTTPDSEILWQVVYWERNQQVELILVPCSRSLPEFLCQRVVVDVAQGRWETFTSLEGKEDIYPCTNELRSWYDAILTRMRSWL